MAGVVESLAAVPRELLTLSGGTRTKVNLSRPWQTDLPYAPEKCPFCTKSEPEAMASLPNWRVLNNPITPHPFHRLVIPKACPTREQTYNLGGRTSIAEALSIYEQVVPVAQAEGFGRTSFAVHVGGLAGQNLGHMHWHVCDADEPDQDIEEVLTKSTRYEKRIVFQRHGLIAYIEGVRTGQLYLVSDNGAELHDETFSQQLAHAIYDVIELYSLKFKSPQGLPPEYVLAVVCKGFYFRYAVYVPILAHWGFPQYLALTGDSKITLPWPHEATVEHLLS